MAITDIDEAKLEAFVGHVATEIGAAVNAALALIGDELGLYRAMADGRPVSSEELAARTGTHERYVREWLAAQAAGGYVEYDPEAATYRLPLEHAAVLADETSPVYQGGMFQTASAVIHAQDHMADRRSYEEASDWWQARWQAYHRSCVI